MAEKASEGIFTEEGNLTSHGRVHLRALCEGTVSRLPTITEFAEWSGKLDAAQTDEQLVDIANRLAWLVGSYKQFRGIDIRRNKTIFERLEGRKQGNEGSTG